MDTISKIEVQQSTNTLKANNGAESHLALAQNRRLDYTRRAELISIQTCDRYVKPHNAVGLGPIDFPHRTSLLYHSPSLTNIILNLELRYQVSASPQQIFQNFPILSGQFTGRRWTTAQALMRSWSQFLSSPQLRAVSDRVGWHQNCSGCFDARRDLGIWSHRRILQQVRILYIQWCLLMLTCWTFIDSAEQLGR